MDSNYDISLHDLLHYSPQHRVLICLECQYAIQKSAIASHLLRHKIYRSERSRILSAVAQLEILEPDHVQLPAPSSRPVAELPVLPGFKCVMPDCGMLYASSKRMKQHWAEIHFMNEQPHPLAEEVQMQTFFRGTKNKYFQVNASLDTPRQAQASTSNSIPELMSEATKRLLTPPSTTPILINMEQLQYFHHFNMATSLVLPPKQGIASLKWKNQVVQKALNHHDLMAGMLALSATQAASVATDEDSRRVHMANSRAFEQQMSAVHSGPQPQEDNNSKIDGSAGLLSQFRGMLRLHAWSRSAHEPDESASSQAFAILQTFSSLVRQSQPNWTSKQHYSASPEIPRPHEVPAPPLPVLRVHKLPYQMISTPRRLENPEDVAAMQEAVHGLSEAVTLSHVYADSTIVWSCLTHWLELLTDYFLEMVKRKDVLALVALAFGAVLIRRAARLYWFLEGCAEKWFASIVAEMPRGAPEISSLVDGLLDDWPEDY